MIKSRGIKASSLFFGVLICMVLMQTAIAQPEGNATTEITTVGNATTEDAIIKNAITPPDEPIISPVNQQSMYTSLSAGSGTQFTYSFTNSDNKTLILTPKVVATHNSQKNISENWITISPANATVTPGSVQNFVVEVAVPRETESGDYQATIAFTDDLVPNTTEYVNSMQIGVSVQALSKIYIDTQYLSDVIDAGKEYEYKISLKNVASKDVTIDPKILEVLPKLTKML